MDPSPLELMIMFFYIYVLQSQKNKRFYIGFTDNLKKRIEKHNRGEVYWTKRHIPWKLMYFEGYRSKIDALNREKNLKHFAKGFAQLKNRLIQTLKEI